MDVLCLSTTDWDEIWGSRQHIMSRLAEQGHRILFIERQVSIEQILRSPKILKSKTESWNLANQIREIQDNIWLFNPPLIPPGRYYSHTLNTAGQRKIAQAITPILSSLGFAHFLLWIYPPQSVPLINTLKPKMVVYHCIDRFTAGQKGRKRLTIQQQEDCLLRSSDCIFVNSKSLFNEFLQRVPRQISLIPSGVDVVHFQKTDAVHPDLEEIPYPRLGLSGTLDTRVDSSLIEKIALSRRDWHIILLGEERPGFRNSVKLHSYPNIHFMGKKPYKDLPLWLNGLDIFLLPYVQDERTFFISPLKFYEYLAVGKPIVTVPLPEIIDFQTHCYLANSPASFINAIESALATDTSARRVQRRQVALSHSWESRIETMMSVIDNQLIQIDAKG